MRKKPRITTKIRVTGGTLKGREFLSPQSALTHPMGAREKLALFNMLAGELTETIVLDAYAGSGALGIEALSRGAREAVFVEKDAGVARVLRENLRNLGLENTEVEVTTVRDYVKEATGGGADMWFDVILADPPYDKIDLTEVNTLAELIKDGGIMVLSHPQEAPNLKGTELIKSKKYAAAHLSLYRRCR